MLGGAACLGHLPHPDCPRGQSKRFCNHAGKELKSRPLAASWGVSSSGAELELASQSRCVHVTVPEAHGTLECTTYPFLGLQSKEVHGIPFQVSCSTQPLVHCSSLSLLSVTCDTPHPFLPKSHQVCYSFCTGPFLALMLLVSTQMPLPKDTEVTSVSLPPPATQTPATVFSGSSPSVSSIMIFQLASTFCDCRPGHLACADLLIPHSPAIPPLGLTSPAGLTAQGEWVGK